MKYLFKRGRGARRRVNHLCGYDPKTGQPSMLPLCGITSLQFDTTSNVPFDQPTCKRCVAAAS